MRRFGLTLACLLVACAGPTESATPEPIGDPAGTWQLVSGASNGADLPIPAQHPITLILEPTSMGGSAACNSYGAEFSLTPEGISIGLIDQTLRGCDAAVQAAETAYLSALRTVTRIGIDGDELLLTGPDVELRFVRLPEPPTADLVDTVWTLDTLLSGDVATVPAGQPATLELRSDGTLRGNTGCRPFDGQWIENGEQLLATTLAMGDMACPAELATQDSHVVSVIGDGFVPTVDGDRLTLMDAGGQGLVYRASE
jgi:heat shock protein HslJ